MADDPPRPEEVIHPELGRRRAVHGADFAVQGGVALALVAAMFGWALLLLSGRLSLSAFLVGALLLKLVGVIRLLPALARVVEVYERGLKVHHLAGDDLVRFDELEALVVAVWPRLLQHGELPPLRRRVVLLHRGGRPAVITDDVLRFEPLLRRLIAEVNANVAGPLMAAHDAGEPVRFGAVVASRDEGLSVGGSTWSWDELTEVDCRLGWLLLPGGRRCCLAVVHNPQLLLRLLELHKVNAEALRMCLRGGRKAAES